MLHASTYKVWARAAKVLDRMSEQVHEADFYDEELIRDMLEEIQRQREDGSLRDVVFCMHGDLVRNLGNMCNPELHKGRLEVIDKVNVASTNSLTLIHSNIFVC
jgi:TAG lipase / steryl ester hydrolase / phospholipase A2 / LPA acyltransferase